MTKTNSVDILASEHKTGGHTVKATEIIEAIRKDKNMSKAELGRALGFAPEEGQASYRPTDVISKRLKQKTINIDLIVDMAKAMNYQVLIVPDGVTVRSDWYKVDGNNE